jgi:autotransporter-associated beta strand protein
MNQTQTKATVTVTTTATGGNVQESETQKQEKQHGQKENRIMKKTFASLTSLVGVGILMLVASLSSHGATWNWNGDGTGDNWSTGDNWVEDTAPVSQNDTIVNFSSSTDITPNADSAWTLQSMNFAGTGGSTTLSGSDLTLGGSTNGTVIDHDGDQGHSVTIDNNISVTNSYDTIRSDGGEQNYTLTLTGDITGPAEGVLQFRGSAYIYVSGNITADRLNKVDDVTRSRLFLSGTNTLNSLSINGGRVQIQSGTTTVSGQITNNSVLEINSGASLGTIANINPDSTGYLSFYGDVDQTFSSLGTSSTINGYNDMNTVVYQRNSDAGDQQTGDEIRWNIDFVKDGDNTLHLTNDNQRYVGTTTVSEGTLRLDGLHVGYDTNNITQLGAGAYSIESGATFASDGTIVTNDANFTVEGTLSPGGSSSPGTLTLDLGSGQLGIGSAESLVFRLGTESDLVLLTDYTDGDAKFVDGDSGTLVIGDGVIGFSDFLFSDSGGLDKGTYTLFDTETAITGSLDGSDLSGWLTADFYGTMGFADGGKDLVLTVIPEPTSGMLLIIGAALALRRRSHRE